LIPDRIHCDLSLIVSGTTLLIRPIQLLSRDHLPKKSFLLALAGLHISTPLGSLSSGWNSTPGWPIFGFFSGSHS